MVSRSLTDITATMVHAQEFYGKNHFQYHIVIIFDRKWYCSLLLYLSFPMKVHLKQVFLILCSLMRHYE